MLAATSKQTNMELGRDGVSFYLSFSVICLPHTLKMIDSIEILILAQPFKRIMRFI